MNYELLVPYGLNPDAILVSAAEAMRETQYRCPECHSPLVLRAGESVVRHFAHKAHTSCTGESVAHLTAKRLLVQIICDYTRSTSHNPISLSCTCACCQQATSIILPPNSFTAASEEQRIGEFVCDVVAYRDLEPVLAIEVLATHAVEERKATSLQIPWLELSAEKVLENPCSWHPVSAQLKPVVCSECKSHIAKLRALAQRWSQPFHEPARARDASKDIYLSAIDTCWKCKNEILVYWWSGVPFATAEPPAPRPKTIQHRYSKKFGGSYWANTCPHCDAVQGDNFLFLGSRPLFQGLPIRDTPEMKAHRAREASQLAKFLFRNIGGG